MLKMQASPAGARRESNAARDYDPDQKHIYKNRDNIVLLCGEKNRGRLIEKILQSLRFVMPGKQMYAMPGGHFDFVDKKHAGKFAESLIGLLEQEGRITPKTKSVM